MHFTLHPNVWWNYWASLYLMFTSRRMKQHKGLTCPSNICCWTMSSADASANIYIDCTSTWFYFDLIMHFQERDSLFIYAKLVEDICLPKWEKILLALYILCWTISPHKYDFLNSFGFRNFFIFHLSYCYTVFTQFN